MKNKEKKEILKKLELFFRAADYWGDKELFELEKELKEKLK